MTELVIERELQFFEDGSDEPVWIIRDSLIPEVEDIVMIENADGSSRAFEVLERVFIVAKQGEHSFNRVRFVIKERQKKTAWMLTRASK